MGIQRRGRPPIPRPASTASRWAAPICASCSNAPDREQPHLQVVGVCAEPWQVAQLATVQSRAQGVLPEPIVALWQTKQMGTPSRDWSTRWLPPFAAAILWSLMQPLESWSLNLKTSGGLRVAITFPAWQSRQSKLFV